MKNLSTEIYLVMLLRYSDITIKSRKTNSIDIIEHLTNYFYSNLRKLHLIIQSETMKMNTCDLENVFIHPEDILFN